MFQVLSLPLLKTAAGEIFLFAQQLLRSQYQEHVV